MTVKDFKKTCREFGGHVEKEKTDTRCELKEGTLIHWNDTGAVSLTTTPKDTHIEVGLDNPRAIETIGKSLLIKGEGESSIEIER